MLSCYPNASAFDACYYMGTEHPFGKNTFSKWWGSYDTSKIDGMPFVFSNAVNLFWCA